MASNWQETYEKLKKRKKALPKKPTSSTKKKDDEDDKWFKSGAFDDGYQIGDITKTILGTAGDVAVGAVKGIGNLAEGVLDLGTYAASEVADLFGNEEAAERIKKQGQKTLVNDWLEPLENKVDKNSLLGGRADNITQGLGYVGGILLTGGLGAGAGLGKVGTTALTTGLTGVSSMGSGMSEAYQGGATDKEAATFGAIAGLAEAGTELLFGGLGKAVNAKGLNVGLSSADDMLAKKISSKFSNQIAKNFAEYGVKAGAEGLEEVMSGFIQGVGKYYTYQTEQDGFNLKQIIKDENLLDQFIAGAVTSGIAQSGIVPGMKNGSLIEANKTGRDFVTGYTQNEQAVIDAEIAARTEGKQLTKKQKSKIEAEVIEDFEKGYISTDTIESTLGGDTYNSLKSLRDNKTNLETQIKELENKPNAEITVKEMEQLKALREELKTVDTNTLESKLQAEMGQKIQSDAYLQRSYQEKAKRSQEFTYETTEKDSQYRKGVMESTKGKLNDTTRSHETAEALVKLSEDRQMQYKFTNNAELRELGLVPEGKTANGLYVVDKDGSREILVNTDSKKYIEAVLVHETAHDFQTTSPETYTKLQDITREFAEAQNEYSRIYSEVAGMYKNVEGVDINEEVTSRLLEDYLGNKDFINSLTTKEPSIVKKIIDEIKYLVKKFTAGSPEARKLVELQHDLEKTYREAYKQTKATETTEGTKYSLDNQGRELSKGQIEYFKDSKIRDEEGNLLTLYHTTDADFNEFDVNKFGLNTGGKIKGIYLTDKVLGNYGDKVIESYVNITNPVTIDSKNITKEQFAELLKGKVSESNIEGAWRYYQNANDLNILYAIQEQYRRNRNYQNNQEFYDNVKRITGYDGLIYSGQQYYANGMVSYVAFNSNQVKKVDNKNPTKNPDTRYSLSDNQGRELSEQQIEYFKNSKVRDEEGRLLEVYHGTKTKGINIFNYDPNRQTGTDFGKAYYFTTDYIKAKGYQYDADADPRVKEHQSQERAARKKMVDAGFTEKARNEYVEWLDTHSIIDIIDNEQDIIKRVDEIGGETKKLYLNLTNPLEVDANGEYYHKVYPEYFKTARANGNDGIIVKNVIDNPRGEHRPIDVYIAFNENQIKNVDNLNPTTDKDIRYSLSEDGKLVDNKGNDITLEASDTGTHGTLMAIHNLSVEKLRGILELGGFPVPSIAITNPDIVNHNQFGNISVLFDKNTIDPLDRRNEVYDRDVWSPTFPQVDYELNDDAIDTVAKNLGIEDWKMKDYAEDNSKIEYLVDRLIRDEAVITKYIIDNELDYEIAYKESKLKRSYHGNEDVQKWINDNDITLDKLAKNKDLRNKYLDIIQIDKDGELYKTLENSLEWYGDDGIKNPWLKSLENDLKVIKGEMKLQPEIDEWKTEKNKKDVAIKNGIEEYLKEQVKAIYGEKGIRNDKEYLTPSGNRRSFWQLHDEYNLENIVDNLTSQDTKGSQQGFGTGFGHIQSQMANRFNSIEDIKNAENRLVDMSETNEKLVEIRTKLEQDLDVLADKSGSDWGGLDLASELVADFAKGKHDIASFRKLLKNYYQTFNGVTDTDIQNIIDDLQTLKEIPTDYFEAKPQRAVGLNEAQAIVIPNNVDAEFKQQLQDAGLKYYEYDPTIEGDRQRVINQFDDLKFSLSNESDIAPTSTRNQTAAQDIRLQVEEAIAPLQEEITQLKQELQNITDIDYAPAPQEVVEAQDREAFNTLDDADSPQQVEDFAPIGEQVTPTDSLFDTRDYEEVGSKKVNAYQYDNPEVRPYFQTAAREMLTDLQNSTRGERFIIGDNTQLGDNDYYYSGTKRATTEDIAELLDGMDGKYKYTYADIEKGLRAIIEDNGAENNAVSKRIEFYLDKRLREGYTDIDGYEIPADTEYLDMLRAKGITDYYNNIPLGEAPVSNVNKPVDNVSNNEIAPTKLKVSEAIRPAPDKDTHGHRLIRVKTDAELQTETNEEIAKILTEEPKVENNRNKRKWAILKANVLDKGIVFEDVALKHKNRELMGKWDYTLTAEARGQNVIGNGHYEYDPYSKTQRQVSKSLNDIRAEVDNTGLTSEFYEYIYHKHNVDRMRLEGRYEGMENKPVFGYNVTAEDSQQVVNKYESQHPEFITFAQDVYDYLDADRQVLVDNGVISQETADLWKSMYPHYVPIRRAGHTGSSINVPLDTGRTGVNAPIKKATGGNKDILPLFDTMASRTLQTYRATAKNSFGVELKNTIGTTINSQATNIDEVIDSVDAQEELLQEGKNGQKPTFTVFENGEKVTFEITEDMYDALKPLDSSSILSKTYGLPSNISGFHRGVLTQYNPVFMLTNAIKDSQDILINSQHAAKTYAKVPEATAQLISKGYWYQEYMNNGGEHNSYFDSVDNTFTTENKGLKKVLDLPPLKQIAQMNDFVERIPRLAEYIASREAGRSIEVSMLDAARVTTNFKAGGNLTKFLNRNGATFLNASVQGAMQQVRNIREANANGIRGWANLATKFAIAGLPAILLNSLIWDDDEEYEELSDYVKQNYYIVSKTEDGTFIRIPKGRTVAVIQEGVRQMQNLATGDDEADLKTFLDLFITNLAPNNPIDNNVLSPIVQVAKNETWYGEDLVPTRLQDLPAAEQYDESTDSFSRWLGEMTNFSPVKINYLLDQYTGGVGDVVLPMMTPEAKSDADTFGEQMLAPLKSKFTANATMNNQNVADFYDTSEKLTTEAKKSTATDEDVLRNKYINSVKAEMNELYAEKREIQNSDLSNSEKYNRVLEVQKQINELSKEALNEYKNVDIYSNYATAGDRQYRLTDEGEWQKINDKQLEKQDNVTSTLGISPNDYWSNKEEYDYAYENPSKYALANAISDYSTFRELSSELYDIKADKDENGKSISGSRKEKVFDYINNLDLDFEQKVMLAKLEYPSYDEYNYEIIEYLNNREDINYEQMVSILTELGFTVKKDGTITWD